MRPQTRRILLSFLLVIVPSVLFGQTVVSPGNLDGWTPTATDMNPAPPPPSVEFVTGPMTPPGGVGSVEFRIPADGDQAAQMRNNNYAGTRLADITELSYFTYVQQFIDEQAPYIILNLTNGDLLFFEPVYQDATFFPTNDQGNVVLNTWQDWDARRGGWWSLMGLAGANPGVGVKSLDFYIANNGDPNVAIATSTAGGAVRLVTGFGAGAWDNFIGNADNFRLATTAINGTGGASDITFDFEPVGVSIADVMMAEGSVGTTNFNFIVTLATAVTNTVTVPFTVTPGTATTPADYSVVTASPLTFTPGTTMQTITVAVVGDTLFEGNETFTVTLGAATNAMVTDGTALGTIQDDEAAPAITINDVTVTEGNAATIPANFTVSLSAPSGLPTTITFTVTDVTANAGTDYVQVTASPLIIPAGMTTGTITVNVNGDVTAEPNETFNVNLTSATNGMIADALGVGTITNDDGADVSIVKTGPAAGFTGNATTYTITVSNAGPAGATGVTVTDVIQAGASATATPSQGTCSGTTTITCNLGAIGVGGTATITLNVITPATGTTFTNTATVTATEGDPNPTNNMSTVVTTLTLSSAIPTMSQWMLMLLAGALAFAAAMRLRL